MGVATHLLVNPKLATHSRAMISFHQKKISGGTKKIDFSTEDIFGSSPTPKKTASDSRDEGDDFFNSSAPKKPLDGAKNPKNDFLLSVKPSQPTKKTTTQPPDLFSMDITKGTSGSAQKKSGLDDIFGSSNKSKSTLD